MRCVVNVNCRRVRRSDLDSYWTWLSSGAERIGNPYHCFCLSKAYQNFAYWMAAVRSNAIDNYIVRLLRAINRLTRATKHCAHYENKMDTHLASCCTRLSRRFQFCDVLTSQSLYPTEREPPQVTGTRIFKYRKMCVLLASWQLFSVYRNLILLESISLNAHRCIQAVFGRSYCQFTTPCSN